MPEPTDSRLARPTGQGKVFQVVTGSAAIMEAPSAAARLASQALFGETVDVFAQEGGFCQVRCQRDHYVGWMPVEALSQSVMSPSHKVTALRTFAYAAPDLKSPVRLPLSLGARVSVTATDGDFAKCAGAGWIHTRHLMPMESCEADAVAIAERYLHTPYLWGGRGSLGLDCTGLTQQAFEAVGVLLPRDSDMQFAWAGHDIAGWDAPGALKRGDLVFWKGHVGIMTDGDHILHANAWHMATACEPLSEAIIRIKTHYAEPIGARRIDVDHVAGQLPHWMAEPVA